MPEREPLTVRISTLVGNARDLTRLGLEEQVTGQPSEPTMADAMEVREALDRSLLMAVVLIARDVDALYEHLGSPPVS